MGSSSSEHHGGYASARAVPPRICYAHTVDGQPELAWEPLEQHLRLVAERAERLASAFGLGRLGFLAGLWHDLGKYQEAFQRRLRGERVQIEHAGAGALLAHGRGGPAWRPWPTIMRGWRTCERLGADGRDRLIPGDPLYTME